MWFICLEWIDSRSCAVDFICGEWLSFMYTQTSCSRGLQACRSCGIYTQFSLLFDMLLTRGLI
jgi:hypothetical protein